MLKTDLMIPKGTTIPNHIAIILDGNRRWARARGLKPWQGHYHGYLAVNKLAEASRSFGVHTFTVWAFSTENWDRPKEEIDEIMKLFRKGLSESEKDFHKDKVALVHLGKKDRLPADLRENLARIENETKKYSSNHVFNLAVDYGGRDEILRAVRGIIEDKVPVEKIDERLFEKYLDTYGQPYPYPDLFIRTSGEQRTSGLLPWQMTYSEYYFEPEHLPDFTPGKLREAIFDFSRRRRRFGGNDAVEHFTFKPELLAKLEINWWRLAKIPEGTAFVDYAKDHLREQFGMSKEIALKAASLIKRALVYGEKKDWEEVKICLKEFYVIIKEELKLAFEPEVVASLEVKLRRELGDKSDIKESFEAEETARELYAEVYRISVFQATKLAHLRVLASIERNLAERGMGDVHWTRAESYLQKFYSALKERVA